MTITILFPIFGIALISLIPIGIIVLVRSGRASYSSHDFWGAFKGFAVFNLGLLTLFGGMWSVADSYWSGSVPLLVATLIIAVGMHFLSLPKLSATVFFIVPMLGYPLVRLTNVNALVPAMWCANLVVLPLIIAAYWVWREARAEV